VGLPVEFLARLSELLENFRVISLRYYTRGEKILHNSIEERDIILQELGNVSITHSTNKDNVFR
jgi:hypothetical protein